MTIQLNPTLNRMWGFKSKQPEIGAWVGGHQKTHMFGALNSKTGRFHSIIGRKINSKVFIRLLKKLKKIYVHKKILIILDNACWHKSKIVKRFCELNRIKLFYLPPYSPNMNPVEKVWKNLRYKVTHNYFHHTLLKLKVSMRRFAIGLIKERKRLISFCIIS